MNLEKKKGRVQKKQLSSRLEDTESLLLQTKDQESEQGSVDTQLLALLKSMNAKDSGFDFVEAVASHLDKIAYDLRLAHHLLTQGDRKGLDTLAQQLTQNALKVGAVHILSGAIEMQGLARMGDFSALSEALGHMEVEYQRVRSQLT